MRLGPCWPQQTLDRAREALKILTWPVRRDERKTSYWLLPHQELPGHVAGNSADEIEERLGRLAELYPPPTALDDL